MPTGVKTSRSSSVTSRPAFWSEDRVGGKASISAAQDWVLGVLSLEVWYVIMGDSPVRSVDYPGVNNCALPVLGGVSGVYSPIREMVVSRWIFPAMNLSANICSARWKSTTFSTL